LLAKHKANMKHHGHFIHTQSIDDFWSLSKHLQLHLFGHHLQAP